jgi:hypothetical protein
MLAIDAHGDLAASIGTERSFTYFPQRLAPSRMPLAD